MRAICENQNLFSQNFIMFCKNDFSFRQIIIMICWNDFWFQQNIMMICRNDFWFLQIIAAKLPQPLDRGHAHGQSVDRFGRSRWIL